MQRFFVKREVNLLQDIFSAVEGLTPFELAQFKLFLGQNKITDNYNFAGEIPGRLRYVIEAVNVLYQNQVAKIIAEGKKPEDIGSDEIFDAFKKLPLGNIEMSAEVPVKLEIIFDLLHQSGCPRILTSAFRAIAASTTLHAQNKSLGRDNHELLNQISLEAKKKEEEITDSDQYLGLNADAMIYSDLKRNYKNLQKDSKHSETLNELIEQADQDYNYIEEEIKSLDTDSPNRLNLEISRIRFLKVKEHYNKLLKKSKPISQADLTQLIQEADTNLTQAITGLNKIQDELNKIELEKKKKEDEIQSPITAHHEQLKKDWLKEINDEAQNLKHTKSILDIITAIKDVNKYLTRRSSETSGLWARFVGTYSGDDYYQRRESWLTILKAMSDQNTTNYILADLIQKEANRFKHRFQRSDYHDVLMRLHDLIFKAHDSDFISYVKGLSVNAIADPSGLNIVVVAKKNLDVYSKMDAVSELLNKQETSGPKEKAKIKTALNAALNDYEKSAAALTTDEEFPSKSQEMESERMNHGRFIR